MFKYKSPLSRLLEGSAKHANKDDSHEDDRDEAAEEPIADLNALRQALAGGNQTTEVEPEAEIEDVAEELVAEEIGFQIDQIAEDLQREGWPIAMVKRFMHVAVERLPE